MKDRWSKYNWRNIVMSTLLTTSAILIIPGLGLWLLVQRIEKLIGARRYKGDWYSKKNFPEEKE